MKVRIEKFIAADMLLLDIQDAQKVYKTQLTEEYGKQFESKYSYTVFDENDIVIFIGGILPCWPGRYVAWALLSKHARKGMLDLTREIKKFLNQFKDNRIECYVDPDFSAAIRWAEMFHFYNEGYMTNFFPNGDDALLYARSAKTWHLQQH